VLYAAKVSQSSVSVTKRTLVDDYMSVIYGKHISTYLLNPLLFIWPHSRPQLLQLFMVYYSEFDCIKPRCHHSSNNQQSTSQQDKC